MCYVEAYAEIDCIPELCTTTQKLLLFLSLFVWHFTIVTRIKVLFDCVVVLSYALDCYR